MQLIRRSTLDIFGLAAQAIAEGAVPLSTLYDVSSATVYCA